MANEIQPFNYGEIEPATAEKLKRHAAAIKGIQSKAVYEIGEELQAAHDELANSAWMRRRRRARAARRRDACVVLLMGGF